MLALKTKIYELVAQGWFPIVCRETNDLVDYFHTQKAAELMLNEYEEQDKKDGIYKPDFYQIISEIPKPYILCKPMQEHINKGIVKLDMFTTDDYAIAGYQTILEAYDIPEEDNLLSIMGDGTEFEAGGVGYDYKVELYLSKSLYGEE